MTVPTVLVEIPKLRFKDGKYVASRCMLPAISASSDFLAVRRAHVFPKRNAQF